MCDLNTVIEKLQDFKLDYHLIQCEKDAAFIVLERGARIIGPFLTRSGESLSWLDQAWNVKEDFSRLIESNAWNVGGCRIWLGPELEYNIQDDKDFWNTYVVPPKLDPGNFHFHQRGKRFASLQSQFTLKAYRSNQMPTFVVSKHIRQARNPLRYLSSKNSCLTNLAFAGYEEYIRLQFQDNINEMIPTSIWNILQVPACGKVILPCTPGINVTDYFEPTGNKHLTVTNDKLTFVIDAKERHKIGIAAAGIFDRVGYHRKLPDGSDSLLIRNFLNIPSAQYTDKPLHQRNPNGDLLQLYNDSGDLGAFGEIECHSPVIEAPDLSEISMSIQTWAFQGSNKEITAIAQNLLGASVGGL